MTAPDTRPETRAEPVEMEPWEVALGLISISSRIRKELPDEADVLENAVSILADFQEEIASLSQPTQPDAVEALREAADWIDRFTALWDDGSKCYEDPETLSGYMGRAVEIAPEEMDDAYDLIDRLRALTTDEEGDDG